MKNQIQKLFEALFLIVLSSTVVASLYAGFACFSLWQQGLSIVHTISQTKVDSSQPEKSFTSVKQAVIDANLRVLSIKKQTFGLVELVPKFKSMDHALHAGLLAVQGTEKILPSMLRLKSATVNLGGLTVPDSSVKKELQQLTAAATGCQEDLKAAVQEMEMVEPSHLPDDALAKFDTIKEVLKAERDMCGMLITYTPMLEKLSVGHSNILLVLQNNNELRATGGFFGTYGKLSVFDGQVRELKISSIYDLDGQLKKIITPPIPIQSVNNRLYLRDANFFADFSKSAELISRLYEHEGGETPDIVIGVNSRIIENMLALTGPIDMPTYGVTIDKDTFLETTQRLTSVDYNKDSNTPKQFLADMIPVLLEKLKSVNPGLLLGLLSKSGLEKDVLLYSRDATIQKLFSESHVSGELPTDAKNYVSIVSSNFSGNKSDAYIQNNLSAEYQLKPDGKLHVILILNKNYPKPSAFGNNLSFTRVFVPNEAVVVEAYGVSNSASLQNIIATKDTPESIKNWNAAYKPTKIAGVFQGQENGQHFFAFWQETKPQSQSEVRLVFEIPHFLNDDVGPFNVLFISQPGIVWHVKTLLHQNGYLFAYPKGSSDISQEFDLISDRVVGGVVERIK